VLRSVFLENGIVIEQETEYNNVTKEAKIQVRRLIICKIYMMFMGQVI